MLHEQLDGATSWHQSSQEVDSGLLSHFLTAQCQLTRLEDCFLRATFGDMPADERIKVMTDLEQYCGRDTEGMIWIVERLEELCR